MTPVQLQHLITRHGRIGVATYEKAARGLRGRAAMRPVRDLVTKFSKSAADPTGQIAGPPDGFGHAFFWDRADEQIVVAVFLNAADSLGISISGLQRGDTVEITAASGIASFSKSDGKLVASLIGLVGAGAAGTVATTGAKDAAPAILKAPEYATQLFDRGEVKTMRRDAFGHKERWLRDHRPRRDDQRPAHVREAFFLVKNDDRHHTRTVSTDRGPLFRPVGLEVRRQRRLLQGLSASDPGRQQLTRRRHPAWLPPVGPAHRHRAGERAPLPDHRVAVT